jgi:hypothetical protein
MHASEDNVTFWDGAGPERVELELKLGRRGGGRRCRGCPRGRSEASRPAVGNAARSRSGGRC